MRLKSLLAAPLLMTSILITPLLLSATAFASDKLLYIISPQDGETVSSPFTVQFGLQGMGVAPAGIEFPNTGHHHLLINVDTLPPLDRPIPTDDQHRHFGAGQTEVTLDLEPGEYSLQLLLGDFTHTPHSDPMISEKITIQVE